MTAQRILIWASSSASPASSSRIRWWALLSWSFSATKVGTVGQPVSAAFSGACACDGGSQRRLDGIDRHVGVFGAVHAQQECVGVTGGVVANGDDHAGFGYPVVGGVLT